MGSIPVRNELLSVGLCPNIIFCVNSSTVLKSFQKKVEEFSDDEGTSKKVVKETKETVTRSNASATAAKTKWGNPLENAYRQLTTSDYPVLVIFACITLITLSYLIEPYIK
jgi:hypothetical protein